MVLGLLYAYRPKKSFSNAKNSAITNSQMSVAQLAALPIKEEIPEQKPESKTFCSGVYEWMTKKTVNEIMTSLYTTVKANELQCFSELDPVASAGFNFSACNSYQQNPQDLTHKKNCHNYLMALRSHVISGLFSTSENFSTMDLSLLSNLILGSFKPAMKPEETKRFWNVTKAYMERMPGQVEPIKAHIMAYSGGLDLKKPEETAYLYDLIGKGLKLAPRDDELIEYKLLIDSLSTDAEKRLEEFSASQPSNTKAYYYIASHQWSLGEKEKALETLQHAIRLNPQEKRFRDAYAKAQDFNTKKEDPITSFVYGYSINLNED